MGLVFGSFLEDVRAKVLFGNNRPAVKDSEPQDVSIKESVRKLSSYVVPQKVSRVKLNQNESPFDVPEKLKEEVTRRLMQIQWNRYPSNFGDTLLVKLSRYLNFPSEGIIIGNSSNELIQSAIYSFCDSGDSVVVTNPGFPIYQRVASLMNIKVREVPLCSDFSFDADALIQAARNARMVLLASPNNPTGAPLPFKDIVRIASSIDGVLLLDEAYFEFFPRSTHELLEELPNLVIVRTFSKAFNMAAARLGYMMANVKLAAQLRKSKLPFSVGIFQQVAGEVIMDNIEFVQKNVTAIVKERERVMTALKEIPGVEPFPSVANFILLFSPEMPGNKLFEALKEKDVLVRFLDSPRLKKCVRVTIGTKEENDIFLEKLREVSAEKGLFNQQRRKEKATAKEKGNLK